MINNSNKNKQKKVAHVVKWQVWYLKNRSLLPVQTQQLYFTGVIKALDIRDADKTIYFFFGPPKIPPYFLCGYSIGWLIWNRTLYSMVLNCFLGQCVFPTNSELPESMRTTYLSLYPHGLVQCQEHSGSLKHTFWKISTIKYVKIGLAWKGNPGYLVFFTLSFPCSSCPAEQIIFTFQSLCLLLFLWWRFLPSYPAFCSYNLLTIQLFQVLHCTWVWEVAPTHSEPKLRLWI